jgi:hypothetical protein
MRSAASCSFPPPRRRNNQLLVRRETERNLQQQLTFVVPDLPVSENNQSPSFFSRQQPQQQQQLQFLSTPPPQLENTMPCSMKSPPKKSLLFLSSDSFAPLPSLHLEQVQQETENAFQNENQLHQSQENHQQQSIAVCLFEKEKTKDTSHAQGILLDATGDTENSSRDGNPNPRPNHRSQLPLLAPSSVQENNNNNNEDENENENHETRKRKLGIHRPEVVSTPEEEELLSPPPARSFSPSSPRIPSGRFDFTTFLRQGHGRIGFVEEREREREGARGKEDQMIPVHEENEKEDSSASSAGKRKSRKRKSRDNDKEEDGQEEQELLLSSSPSVAFNPATTVAFDSQEGKIRKETAVKMENNPIEPRRSTRKRRITTKASSSSWPYPPPRTRSAAAKKNDIGDDDDDDESLCSCSSRDLRFPTVKSTYPTTRMIFEEEDGNDSRKQKQQPQSASYQTIGRSSSVIATERITPRIGSRYQADIPPFLGKKSLDFSSSSLLLENRVWIPSLLPDDLSDYITANVINQSVGVLEREFIGEEFPVHSSLKDLVVKEETALTNSNYKSPAPMTTKTICEGILTFTGVNHSQQGGFHRLGFVDDEEKYEYNIVVDDFIPSLKIQHHQGFLDYLHHDNYSFVDVSGFYSSFLFFFCVSFYFKFSYFFSFLFSSRR